jgi:hypothetical protein
VFERETHGGWPLVVTITISIEETAPDPQFTHQPGGERAASRPGHSGLRFSRSMWCRPSCRAVRSPARLRRSSPSHPHEHCAAYTSGAPYLERRSRILISCTATIASKTTLQRHATGNSRGNPHCTRGAADRRQASPGAASKCLRASGWRPLRSSLAVASGIPRLIPSCRYASAASCSVPYTPWR